MIVLGIDPGSRCGFAVRQANGDMDAGTWDLRPRRFEGGGMRFLRLRRNLVEVINDWKPDLVAFEEVRRHMGVDAAHVYGGIIAVIQEECERRDPPIPYLGVPVGTVKRAATGKGNAGKPEMIAAANERWGLDLKPADENEADARWIAEAAAREYGGQPTTKKTTSDATFSSTKDKTGPKL